MQRGDCDARPPALFRPLIGRSGRQSESRALLGEQIMKWSSNSGSLLSLSQWLHTHSCSVPSPCCPLSAGLGSPSLTKSCSRDSPMRKCLKSWTEGKAILSIEMSWEGGLLVEVG